MQQTEKADQAQTVVISKADVDVLIDRLMGFEEALKRNVLHARHYEDGIEDVVDNILYDFRYGVVEAWAEKHFPGSFSGITAAQAGQFNQNSFELFEEHGLIDDLFCEDEIDRLVAARQRRELEAGAVNALNAGELVFRADRNYVTSTLQFRSGRYSTEEDMKRWYRSLNDEQVRVYGVFAEMVPNGAVNCCVRFVSLNQEDPSANKSVFLGWAFFKGNETPAPTSFLRFGEQFGAIFGFVDAKFSDDELSSSTYEYSVGRKWTVAAD